MRLTAIFLVYIFAVVLGENIDLNLPGKKFFNGANNVEAPALELNVPMDQLKGTMINAVGLYIDQIVNQLNNQAYTMSDLLQDNIQRVSKALYNSTVSVGNNLSSDSLDDDLCEVNKVLSNYLDLLPGNAKIKRKSLPALPNEMSVILPNKNARTQKELFLDLETILNNDLAMLYQVINTIYIEGWRSTGLSLYRLQDQFRDEMLNEDVLETYRNVVVAIYANAKIIKPHVSLNVWEEFDLYGSEVNKAYDDVTSANEL